MKSISAAKRSSVVSLLNEGYSHHQVQARTGLGKGTIGRISQEVVGIRKIILVVVLPSFLLVINSLLSVKSALADLTMQSKPPDS
jgi:hypothetical protein